MIQTPKPKTAGIPEFNTGGRIDYSLQDWIDYCLKNEGKQITVPFNLKDIASQETAKSPEMAEDMALAPPSVRPGDPNAVRGVVYAKANPSKDVALAKILEGQILNKANGDNPTMRAQILMQGKPRVNLEAGIHFASYSPNFIAAEIDMHTKWCNIDMIGGSEDGLVLGIGLTERSLHMDESAEEGSTIIEFPDHKSPEWDIFAAECNRYTLRVVFLRRESVDLSESKVSEFQKAAKALVDAMHAFYVEGSLTPVAYKNLREASLTEAITALAEELGVTLEQPLQVDSRGNLGLSVKPADLALGREQGSPSFGEAFSALLNQYMPRTGVATTAHLIPENGWCYLSHFQAEAMVLDRLAAQRG
jgi:hypothetical protein